MSDPQQPPHRLPTLTEVVPIEVPPAAGVVDDTPATAPRPAEPASTPPALPEHAAIVATVLEDVQRQIGLMLEVRLREAIAPALARFTDTLAREARNELSAALRAIVERAVAQELARHRDRGGAR